MQINRNGNKLESKLNYLGEQDSSFISLQKQFSLKQKWMHKISKIISRTILKSLKITGFLKWSQFLVTFFTNIIYDGIESNIFFRFHVQITIIIIIRVLCSKFSSTSHLLYTAISFHAYWNSNLRIPHSVYSYLHRKKTIISEKAKVPYYLV